MVVKPQKYLTPIASLLKVELDNVKINNVPNSGVTSTIFKLLNKSNSFSLGPKNQLEKIEIQQWIEYIVVYASHVDTTPNTKIVFKELNEILALKTYLISHRLTIADVLLFYVLLKAMNTYTDCISRSIIDCQLVKEKQPIYSLPMSSLLSTEKEKYLNVCRWFDNLQQEEILRQHNKMINFSSNFLAAQVPVKH